MDVPQHNLLAVDEGARPRANSDPTVGTGVTLPMLLLPEITVEDCGDPELQDGGCGGGDEGWLSSRAAPQRPRSNTCPEDLFRRRNGRPPTPPPGTFRKGHRFKSGFSKPVLKESVSFTHHKLSKLTETEDAAEEPHGDGGGGGGGGGGSSAWNPFATFGERLGSRASPSGAATRSRTNAGQGPRSENPDRFRAGGAGAGATTTATTTTTTAAAAAAAAAESGSRCASTPGDTTTDTGGESTDSGSAADPFVSSSSVKCRFAQTKPRGGLDSTQLQAC